MKELKILGFDGTEYFKGEDYLPESRKLKNKDLVLPDKILRICSIKEGSEGKRILLVK